MFHLASAATFTAHEQALHGDRLVHHNGCPVASWLHRGVPPEPARALPSLSAGRYRVVFATDEYMAGCRQQHPGIWPAQPFYPTVSVVFNVAPDQVQNLLQPRCRTVSGLLLMAKLFCDTAGPVGSISMLRLLRLR